MSSLDPKQQIFFKSLDHMEFAAHGRLNVMTQADRPVPVSRFWSILFARLVPVKPPWTTTFCFCSSLVATGTFCFQAEILCILFLVLQL
jgi:hypothetical protein